MCDGIVSTISVRSLGLGWQDLDSHIISLSDSSTVSSIPPALAPGVPTPQFLVFVTSPVSIIPDVRMVAASSVWRFLNMSTNSLTCLPLRDGACAPFPCI